MRDIKEMAREAGLRDWTCNGKYGCLDRFAALARADEREIQAEAFQQILAATRNAVRADERARIAEQPAQQEPVAMREVLVRIAHFLGIVQIYAQDIRPRHELETDIPTWWKARKLQDEVIEVINLLDITPPAQRKPLTDEQWQVIADTLHCCISRGQKDTIEAAIGIKENT